MADINKDTDLFINRIKEEEVYKRFKAIRDKVYSDADIGYQLDEFRKRSFEIQVGHSYGYYNSYEQLLQLNNQYEQLLTNPDVEEFLARELEVSKLVSGIIGKIADDVDIKLDFLEF